MNIVKKNSKTGFSLKAVVDINDDGITIKHPLLKSSSLNITFKYLEEKQISALFVYFDKNTNSLSMNVDRVSKNKLIAAIGVFYSNGEVDQEKSKIELYDFV